MSAFIQDKAHIDALVAVAVRGPSGRTVSPDTAWYGPRWNRNADGPSDYVSVEHTASGDTISANELGALLWAENVRSIQYRYPDTIEDPGAMPGPITFSPADVLIYSWPYSTPLLSTVDALAALSGYEYQACECPEWGGSEAYRFCVALRLALCGVLERGATEGTWSLTEDALRTYRARQLGLVAS